MHRRSGERKTRHLVLHDYGMGGLWWWVWAGSAEEIALACAEVEVVTDPYILERVRTWALEEVHLDAPDPNPLSDPRAQRDAQRNAQRDQPGFGALAGRDRVYPRWQGEDAPEVFLMEIGPDGRRLRQVEIGADGTAVKTGPEDWPFNPPCDLYDPWYASPETSGDDFEEAWLRARPGPRN
ncbi:hypothetical protein KGD83_17830 [Nocardiopsis akebiae]|uniref:Uncharacterized protein n=1 Tax=Nocardiopsis akebiae TaxID=2831968 RepID=A0ABX8C157_9ACTN|nr:hypothetical protein [Nocardiopsis akebiae]QUX27187.1 hypothetical protein KGD83_17830 [Nocardiopsis akebiae]